MTLKLERSQEPRLMQSEVNIMKRWFRYPESNCTINLELVRFFQIIQDGKSFDLFAIFSGDENLLIDNICIGTFDSVDDAQNVVGAILRGKYDLLVALRVINGDPIGKKESYPRESDRG